MRKRRKKTNLLFLIFIVSIFFSACGGRGTFTVVNTTLEPTNINFNDKSIALAPEQHFTQKGLKPGLYKLKVGVRPPINIRIDKKRTTLSDISGDNCFIVADYTDQYGEKGTGEIRVVEKFVNENAFTTSSKITSELGEKLPQGTKGYKRITRIHRVDCSWIDNDQAIIDAIANLP